MLQYFRMFYINNLLKQGIKTVSVDFNSVNAWQKTRDIGAIVLLYPNIGTSQS